MFPNITPQLPGFSPMPVPPGAQPLNSPPALTPTTPLGNPSPVTPAATTPPPGGNFMQALRDAISGGAYSNWQKNLGSNGVAGLGSQFLNRPAGGPQQPILPPGAIAPMLTNLIKGGYQGYQNAPAGGGLSGAWSGLWNGTSPTNPATWNTQVTDDTNNGGSTSNQ